MLAIARALMSLSMPSLVVGRAVARTGTTGHPQSLFERLAALNRTDELTQLIVEQNANLALAIGHRAYVLETGEIMRSGTAGELRADDAVRRAYLGF